MQVRAPRSLDQGMKEKRARVGLGWPSGWAAQGSWLPGGLHVTLTNVSASQLLCWPPHSYPPQSITGVWGQGSRKEGEKTCSSLSWNLTHSQWKTLNLPLCPIKLPSFMLRVSGGLPWSPVCQRSWKCDASAAPAGCQSFSPCARPPPRSSTLHTRAQHGRESWPGPLSPATLLRPGYSRKGRQYGNTCRVHALQISFRVSLSCSKSG